MTELRELLAQAGVEEAVVFSESLSFNERQEGVREALRGLHPRSYCWVRDMWDDHVVYEVNRRLDDGVGERARLYSRTYTTDADGQVALGEGVEVKAVTKYVTAEGEVIERKFDKNVGGGVDRDKIPAEDFAGPDRSFPIVTQADVEDALRSLGRAKGDRAAIKRRIFAIAKRKGFSIPKGWQDGKESDADWEPCLEGDLVPLVERALASDNTIDLKVITPGWGSSGYYSKEVLERDGPKTFPAGTHMYLDHPTESENRERPERSVRDLAGALLAPPAYQEDGKDGPGLYAKAKVLPEYKDTIEALAEHIGVSIRAHGTVEPGEAEGKQGAIVKEMTKGLSVDFVTKAGRGGKVLQLMESLRSNGTLQTHTQTDSGTSQEDDKMELKEAQDKITELTGQLATVTSERDELLAQNGAMKTGLLLGEAKKVARQHIATAELPDVSKDRIVEAVAANPPVKDGELDIEALKVKVDEAARVEAEYLTKVTGAGQITGQGSQGGGAKDETAVKESLAKGMTRFFGLSEQAAKHAAERR
jgi:hypothetical protein